MFPPLFRSQVVSLVAAAFIVLTLTRQAGGQARFTVHDLGTLGGLSSQGQGINNSGQVTGASTTPGGNTHAFRTAPNMPINARSDDIHPSTVSGDSYAFAINRHGQVVGYVQTASPFAVDAFRTKPDQRINPVTDYLGTGGLNRFCEAFAVNDIGQAVGQCLGLMAHQNVGFRTKPDSPIDGLTDGVNFGYFSEVRDINNAGQIAGSGGPPPNFDIHAFRQDSDNVADDLHTLGNTYSHASGLNAKGQVVGESSTPDGSIHAFRTAPDSLINEATDDLGTLGGTYSSANAINRFGEVVGTSDHAFLYAEGKMSDLNGLISPRSGVTLESATAINDLGQIVVNGMLNGNSHAFRLDPTAIGYVHLLLDAVISFNLAQTTRAELTAPLYLCLEALHGRHYVAALYDLATFQATVRAIRGKQLSNDEANSLLDIEMRGAALLFKSCE